MSDNDTVWTPDGIKEFNEKVAAIRKVSIDLLPGADTERAAAVAFGALTLAGELLQMMGCFFTLEVGGDQMLLTLEKDDEDVAQEPDG